MPETTLSNWHNINQNQQDICVHKAWSKKTDRTTIAVLQVNLVLDDYMKVTTWRGEKDTFQRRGLIFNKRVLLIERFSKLLTVK